MNIDDYIDESIHTKKLLKKQIPKIQNASTLIQNSLNKGGKLIFFGNGGSAADAQHIVAEFIGHFEKNRIGFPAISLTTNSSVLTAIGNDFDYESIFSRQLEALSKPEDVIIAISTSGNSKNVIKALNFARKKKLTTIGLTGKNGGKLISLVDLAISVPSDNTQHIQESHIMIGHILVSLIENNIT